MNFDTSNWGPASEEEWSEIRERGMLRFMLTTGSIFGILLYAFLVVYHWVFEAQPIEELILTWRAFIQFLLSIVAGIILYGGSLWIMNEWQFKRSQDH